MMRTTRTLLFAGLAAVGALLLAVAAAVGSALLAPGEAAVDRIGLHASEPVHIGQTVRCFVVLRVPWLATPKAKSLDLPDGLQLAGSAETRASGVGFRSWKWRWEARLQPLRTGELAPGEVEFRLDWLSVEDDSEPVAVQLPPIVVEPRPEEAVRDLHLAAAVAGESGGTRTWRWALGLVAAALLAALLTLGILRHRRAAQRGSKWRPPAHDRALAALQDVEDRLPIDPVPFYVEVTDILRRYVEERFAIRAAEQTTPEFLRSVAEHDGIEPGHRQTLQDFMNASDKVKFARERATQDDVREALRQARGFVAETAPHPEEEAQTEVAA